MLSTPTDGISVNNKSDVALFREGMNHLKSKEFENTVEVFTELEIVHPVSIYSSKSQLMAGSLNICLMSMKRLFLR